MDADTLTDLVERRHQVLLELLELGDRQADAVRHNRMSELLEILNRKQVPLETLGRLSDALREAVTDDPGQREWASPQARAACRQLNEACEQMLQRLMRQEAEAETELASARDALDQELAVGEGKRRAAGGYSAAAGTPTTGGRIDLSSR